MIIDDVDSKLPFCLGFSRPVGARGWEKRFLNLSLVYNSYVARIYMNKGENMPVFFFDVTEYIKYAEQTWGQLL